MPEVVTPPSHSAGSGEATEEENGDAEAVEKSNLAEDSARLSVPLEQTQKLNQTDGLEKTQELPTLSESDLSPEEQKKIDQLDAIMRQFDVMAENERFSRANKYSSEKAANTVHGVLKSMFKRFTTKALIGGGIGAALGGVVGATAGVAGAAGSEVGAGITRIVRKFAWGDKELDQLETMEAEKIQRLAEIAVKACNAIDTNNPEDADQYRREFIEYATHLADPKSELNRETQELEKKYRKIEKKWKRAEKIVSFITGVLTGGAATEAMQSQLQSQVASTGIQMSGKGIGALANPNNFADRAGQEISSRLHDLQSLGHNVHTHGGQLVFDYNPGEFGLIQEAVKHAPGWLQQVGQVPGAAPAMHSMFSESASEASKAAVTQAFNSAVAEAATTQSLEIVGGIAVANITGNIISESRLMNWQKDALSSVRTASRIKLETPASEPKETEPVAPNEPSEAVSAAEVPSAKTKEDSKTSPEATTETTGMKVGAIYQLNLDPETPLRKLLIEKGLDPAEDCQFRIVGFDSDKDPQFIEAEPVNPIKTKDGKGETKKGATLKAGVQDFLGSCTPVSEPVEDEGDEAIALTKEDQQADQETDTKKQVTAKPEQQETGKISVDDGGEGGDEVVEDMEENTPQQQEKEIRKLLPNFVEYDARSENFSILYEGDRKIKLEAIGDTPLAQSKVAEYVIGRDGERQLPIVIRAIIPLANEKVKMSYYSKETGTEVALTEYSWDYVRKILNNKINFEKHNS